MLTFPAIQGFADRLLGPNECVNVTYRVGLAVKARFEAFIDVLGDIVEPVVMANTAAQTASLKAGKKTAGPTRAIRLSGSP